MGVDRGVFYPAEGTAEVWNGLLSVTESPADISSRVRYLNGRKIVNRRREDSYSATISAFSHPTSFLQASRTPFGLSYRTQTAKGHRIHVVYNAMAHISGRTYTQGEQLSPLNVDITTRPMRIPGATVSAHLIVDTSVAWPHTVAALEDILYGTSEEDARLPTPTEAISLFEDNSIVRVVDNGDGSATITGPDDAVRMLDATTGQIAWPSVVFIGEETYRISSL